MTRTFGSLVTMMTMLWAVPALAQSAPADELRWYAGLNVGTAVVEKFSGVFGLDAGVRVWPGIDIVGEAVWAGNVVARRQIDGANTLADAIAATQKTSASASLEAPMRYLGAGVRYVFEQDGLFKPYGMFTLGAARRELKPTFTLNGTDITASVAQYGVTLGRDVIGVSDDFAAELGVGILMRQGAWYGDASARLTSISGETQRVNVARLVIGGGYRF